MENQLFWMAIGFVLSQIVIGIWVYTNNSDRSAEHEKLKVELAKRLFLRNQTGTYDLPSTIEAILTYQKLRLEGTRGVKVVKE